MRISYQYDGTFAGFLTCLDDCRRNHFTPEDFATFDEGRVSLFAVRSMDSDPQKAKEVYASLRKISREVQGVTAYAFLTCMEEKEMAIYDFLRLAQQIGPGVIHWETDSRVARVLKAVRHLQGEAHLLKGFVRFADYGGFLGAEIDPKNRVLPLLKRHFSGRYNTENFLIYDKTHGEVLFHRRGDPMRRDECRLVSVQSLHLPEVSQREQAWQSLWQTFYDTIAIEGRINPKLRMTHVPKRYWKNMSELRDEL